MRSNKIWFLTLLIFLVVSCNEEKKEAKSHTKGVITLQYDDAYINIAEALSHRYENAYPDTKINLKVSKEDQALEDLLNKKTELIIMSRDLTEEEKKYWDLKINRPFQPSYFAADGVCFVVSKNNPKEYISLEEIKENLTNKERKLIFEGVNTSNFNAVINKFGLSLERVSFSKIEGNENIINSLNEKSNHIGVVSYNTISNPHSEKAKKLKEEIKILPVKVGDTLISPNRESLKSQKYPFTKLLYFLTSEEKFGLANGFMRYSCLSIGQKIVSKEGLQPYYLFPRTVKINTE